MSEDPGRSGSNWFAYADSDPTNKVDCNGKSSGWTQFMFMVGCGLVLASLAFADVGGLSSALDAGAWGVAFLAAAWLGIDGGFAVGAAVFIFGFVMSGPGGHAKGLIDQALAAADKGQYTLASVAIGAAYVYMMATLAMMVSIDVEDDEGFASRIVGSS